MSKTFQEWLGEGEALYEAAMKDYQAMQAQMDELEAKLAAKQIEVNQIAEIIGKPAVEGPRRLSATIIEPERGPSNGAGHLSAAPSPAAIARALTGRVIGR